jgi:hypothetical protein
MRRKGSEKLRRREHKKEATEERRRGAVQASDRSCRKKKQRRQTILLHRMSAGAYRSHRKKEFVGRKIEQKFRPFPNSASFAHSQLRSGIN